ncbi:hypothetical protein [Ravibacter arvi]
MLALLSAPPKIDATFFSDDHSYWYTVEKQSENIFGPIAAPRESHAAKKTFRLTVPLIAKTLDLKRKGIYLLQVTTFFVMLGMGISLARRITSESKVSSLFMASMIPLYTILSSYHEATGHLDAFAYSFLFGAMYFRHPLQVFFACFLASWCDERAFLATSFIFMWWFLQDENANRLRVPSFSAYPDSRAVAVCLSGLSYIALRFLLTFYTPLSLEMGRADLLLVKEYTSFVPLLTYSTFGALWAVILTAGLLLIRQNRPLLLLFLIIPFLLQAIVACMVWDFTRSLSFAFPLLFLSLFIVKDYFNTETIKIGLCVIFLLSLISPVIFFDSQITNVHSIWHIGFDKLIKVVTK